MPLDNKVLCLYVPVIHQGYLDLFSRHKGFKGPCDAGPTIFIFGKGLISEFQDRKEIRALDPHTAVKLVKNLNIFEWVDVLTLEFLPLLQKDVTVVLANDQLSKKFAEKYLKDCPVEWDTTFLRWDESNVFSQDPLEGIRTSEKENDRRMIEIASNLRANSSDWWRQVGAIVVKDGEILDASFNQHLPTEYTPYINGDPRDSIKAGEKSEFCSALHSEQTIVADAARKVLQGTDIYLTVFPCPVCAKLLARAGIKKCFFKSGHSSLDGRSVFEAFGVEMIRVS